MLSEESFCEQLNQLDAIAERMLNDDPWLTRLEFTRDYTTLDYNKPEGD